MNAFLYEASGELVRLDRLDRLTPEKFERCRFTDTDALGYFRQLVDLDVDWVVNLDEDAFVLDPRGLVELVQLMDAQGYAACGMPDGGVVRIRRHNPVACNAFFNDFDLRRVRPAWKYWERVVAARHKGAYEAGVVPFARRLSYAFDHFERYYGVFFALLEEGERILYLDARTWDDGVSTLLHDHAGRALLLHCWYTRNWPTSYHTRRRYRAALAYAQRAQGLHSDGATGAAAEEAQPQRVAPSNAGNWEALYRHAETPFPYGDTLTYRRAAQYLAGLETVEDWGCGCAWFKRYLEPGTRYKGVDGSPSPYADEGADLTTYRSQTEGLLLRHVLEHNSDWPLVLRNAVASFRKRMVLVLFTPFTPTTRRIAENASLGVPDLAFAPDDLVHHFAGLRWSLEANLPTQTQYGVEHIFYVEKD
jgi:hypothetical protein